MSPLNDPRLDLPPQTMLSTAFELLKVALGVIIIVPIVIVLVDLLGAGIISVVR